MLYVAMYRDGTGYINQHGELVVEPIYATEAVL